MNKFLQSFKNKNFRYGSYSILMTAIVLAVLIVLNLIVSEFSFKLDLTENALFSLSEKSIEVISELDEDVTLYVLSVKGQDDLVTEELLNEYEKNAKNINVIYKSPSIYPTFAENYRTDNEPIYPNSIIVESNSRFKVISPYELDLQYTNGYYQAESKITSAINYVTMTSLPTIYYVTGHQEAGFSSRIEELLALSNYTIKSVSTLTEEIPDDCDALIMTTPEVDYTAEEVQKIMNFLTGDGRAFIAANTISTPLENFNSIIETYGLELNNNTILDVDPNSYFQDNPALLLPKMTFHDVNEVLGSLGYPILIPGAQSISESGLKKSSINLEPLLSTSNSSYSKEGFDWDSINKMPEDATGPFNIAYAITDETYTNELHTTKLVVMGSSEFMLESIDNYISGFNSVYTLSVLNWLIDTEDEIYINPKTELNDSVIINQKQKRNINLICMGLIPIGILCSGFFVWQIRRNK